jgi:aryl-alcohol dehydrogenase-like predicted oxidoreductase
MRLQNASRLALGTVQFGLNYGVANQVGQVPPPQVEKMLRLASARNVDLLDTAAGYGDSEACLGAVGTGSFKVVTKLPAIPEDCSDVKMWVRNQFSESLIRLNVDSVYGLLIHNPSQLSDRSGAVMYQELRSMQTQGFVEKIGVSIYSPDILDELMSRYRFDLVQAPFNLVDRRLYNSGWLGRLKNEGIEIHVRSVFMQGLLLMESKARPPRFEPWSKLWQRWSDWLASSDASKVASCLAYPLSFSEVDRVVVGADSPLQLEEIISASEMQSHGDFPDIESDDEMLINPFNWAKP